MASSDKMPRVNMTKEFVKLNETDKHFVKKIENLNLERAGKVTKLRFNNKVTALLLAGAVIGIYSYTIMAVKQEKFLDDFDKVPEKK